MREIPRPTDTQLRVAYGNLRDRTFSGVPESSDLFALYGVLAEIYELLSKNNTKGDDND